MKAPKYIMLLTLGVGIRVFGLEVSVETVLEPVHRMEVSAPQDGIVENILVEEGDVVVVGDVLIEFEHREEALLVERSEQVVRKREFDFNSAKELFADDMTSQTEMLEKEIELNVARIDLEQAQEGLERRVLKAVQSGIVTERHQEIGEYVERGEPLFEIVDTNEVDARFYVVPAIGIELRVGDWVAVEISLLERTERGQLVFVDSQVDPSSGLMRVRARIDNSKGTLRAGLRGWIREVTEGGFEN